MPCTRRGPALGDGGGKVGGKPGSGSSLRTETEGTLSLTSSFQRWEVERGRSAGSSPILCILSQRQTGRDPAKEGTGYTEQSWG